MKKTLCIIFALIFTMTVFGCGYVSQETSTDSVLSQTTSNSGNEISDDLSDTDTCSDESTEPFFDTLDLLRLFGPLDAYESGEANDFINFVSDTFGMDTLREIYQYIKREGYSDSVWYEYTGNTLHVLRALYLGEHKTADNIRLISIGERNSNKETVLTFGGDICLADNYATMPHLLATQNGLTDCIDPSWIEIMQSDDISVLNNEFAISDRGSPMPGKLYTFLAKPEHTARYNDMGVDFVTLANNHVFDYGEDAFCDTLDTLKEYDIDYAGAGRNADEAQKPFYYLVDGRKIAFVSATRAEKYILTPEAGESSPGVFRCYDTARLLEVIAETKQNCDFLVLFVHWGTEYSAKLETVQATTSHDYIDAGADLIIGSHAHQLQGIEFYNGKCIFYNLGNFWFNAKNIETGLAQLKISADGSVEYYFLPGMQSGCETSYELGTELGRRILDNIASYQPDIIIEDNGRVLPKE